MTEVVYKINCEDCNV